MAPTLLPGPAMRTSNRSPKILGLAILALSAVACGEPSPVVLGSFSSNALRQALLSRDESALSRGLEDDADDSSSADRRGSQSTLKIEINGFLRDVVVSTDGSFAIDDLPTGDVTLSLDVGEFSGSITVKDLTASEIVEIAIEAGAGRLEIIVIRREKPTAGGSDVPLHHGPVQIDGNNQVFYLEPGVYAGDFTIRGNRVTVVGRGCGSDGTTIDGDFTIRGNNIQVVNLSVLGSIDTKGNKVRFFGACTRQR